MKCAAYAYRKRVTIFYIKTIICTVFFLIFEEVSIPLIQKKLVSDLIAIILCTLPG